MTYEDLIKDTNILLVDDDVDYLEVTYSYLKFRGFNIDKVSSGKEALEAMNNKSYQIVLVDYFMPSMTGEELINTIREGNKEIIIILQTGFSGQKPPIETMKRLNIQNYHDKTEGIDRLHLELISAIKIFAQQIQITLTRYKSSAIGSLVVGIAGEIKSTLLSLGAGIEYTNMLIGGIEDKVSQEDFIKINKFYKGNREYLEKTDKILTAIIEQLSSDRGQEVVLSDSEVTEIIELILFAELKQKNVTLETKTVLKSESYLSGQINDIIFVVCEIIRKMVTLSEENGHMELFLTEDDENWIFRVETDLASRIEKNDLYILNNIVLTIKNVKIEFNASNISLIIKKKEG